MIDPFKVFIPETVKTPIIETLYSGFVGQGKKVDLFESELSSKFELKNVVTLNSGTSALRLALALAGVGPNDEVITTPYTMVATNTAILEQYAVPVFADIQYDTCNIDPKDIEHRITEKTKAIMCVHWGGYPCDMDEITKIAKKHNLIVIEDAAHALNATYKGKKIGTISDYTTFSFQAIKQLTTVDGGMITVKDNKKYEEALRRRWFGIDRKNRGTDLSKDPISDITELGFKYHMNDVSAVIGLSQLPYFDENSEKRKNVAEKYRYGLGDIKEIRLLKCEPDRTPGNWMFAIHVDDRNEFIKHMLSKGIGVTVHNWRNDRYSIFGGKRNDLPNLDKLDKTLVNLPIHHAITEEDVDFIISEIKKYYKR